MAMSTATFVARLFALALCASLTGCGFIPTPSAQSQTADTVSGDGTAGGTDGGDTADDAGTTDTGGTTGTADGDTTDTGEDTTGTGDTGTGVGECANESDLAAIDDPDSDVDAAAEACSGDCDDSVCFAECLAAELGLSEGCSACFWELLSCLDAAGEECEVELMSCSGLDDVGCDDDELAVEGARGETCYDMSCDGVAEALASQIPAPAGDALACEVDQDCIIVDTSTDCGPTCGVAVSAAAAAVVLAQVEQAEALICAPNDFAGACGDVEIDCAAAEPGCVDGGCVYDKMSSQVQCGPAEYLPSPDADTCAPADCLDMTISMWQVINAVAFDAKACDDDAECVVLGTPEGCQGGCGHSINKSAEADYLAAAQWAEGHICSVFAPACTLEPMQDCPEPNPGCVDGECVTTVDPPIVPVECPVGTFQGAPQSGKCIAATCDNITGAVDAAFEAALAGAQACENDDECTIFDTSTPCGGTCGVPVNINQSLDLNIAIKWAGAKACGAIDFAVKCGYSTPGCVEPNPGCQDGMCVYSK